MLVRIKSIASASVTSRDERSAPGHGRWFVLLLMALSLGHAAYQCWAYRSDAAASQVFHGSDSCLPLSADSTSAAVSGACRREYALVVGRRTIGSGTSRSRVRYRLLTISSDGTREDTELTSYDAAAFWRRMKAGDRIALQRFVAPGFSLTGEVTAFADSLSSVGTYYHPDSRARSHGLLATSSLGVLAVASLMLWLSVVAARGQPRPA